MGRISDEDVARVRDATDLVSLISERIVLKQKGRLFWGLCPFHGEKTPSFKVDPATQLWHCFGCGLGGDAFGFVKQTENVEFPDAVRILADRARIELHEDEGGVPRGARERMIAACEEAAEFYHRVLTASRDDSASKARSYLSARSFGSGVAKHWKLGFAPGRGALVSHLTGMGYTADELVNANLALRGDDGRIKDRFFERVMFPITDLQGRCIAFGGRVLGKGEPKYLNTAETPIFSKSRNMYGIDRAKASITSTGAAIVVEGYTDVIALHEAGITNVVATLGTALTRQHVKLLGRFAKRIVYLFDGDAAGMRAADRAVEFIDRTITPEAGAERVDLVVAIIPDGLDPADFVSQRGADAMREVTDGGVPLLRFAIDRRLARWDLDRPEERSRALRDAAEVLAPVKDSLLADDYANYIADRLGAGTMFETVRRAIASVKPGVRAEESEAATTGGASVAVAVASPRIKAERELLALLVGVPRLRGRAQELLATDVLAEQCDRDIASQIAAAGERLSPADLVGRIEAAVPGAAALLSGADASVDAGVEPEVAADELLRRLKEFDLEHRIATGKARLKDRSGVKDPAEYDELFREVSALQRELDQLRRGA